MEMEQFSGSFLQILQDDTQITYGNSTITPSRSSSLQWDDENSFEVSEVPHAASSDVSLAEALRSIDNAHELSENPVQNQRTPAESCYGGEINLKQELRAKIQSRRISEGVGELHVQFEPPKSHPLTPEETEKVQKRKRRNRLSANKSRLRRKMHEDCLQKQVDDLEEANGKLSKEIAFLGKMKQLFQTKMAKHECANQRVTSSSTTILNTVISSESVNMQRLVRRRTNTGFPVASKTAA